MERTAISRSGLGVALGVLREGLVRASQEGQVERWEAGLAYNVHFSSVCSLIARVVWLREVGGLRCDLTR